MTLMRMESAPFRAKQFIAQNLAQWVKDTVISEAIRIAKSKSVPDRYIQSIKWEPTGDFSGNVTLDFFGAHGEPLGKWFELGTKDHGPVTANTLAWPDPNSRKYIYAKHVRGIKAKNIMQEASDSGLPLLEKKIIEETNRFLQESKMT